MTNDEARELARRWRAGDAKAREALVLAYRGLAIKWARAYPQTRARRDDAEQEGVIGLLRAIDSYDPDHPSGAGFLSYASRWVRAAVREFAKRASVVHVTTLSSAGGDRAWSRIGDATRQLERNGITPTHEALAERLGVQVSDVEAVMQCVTGCVRLDAPRRVGRRMEAVMDAMKSDAANPEELTGDAEERVEIATRVYRALALVGVRESDIIRRTVLADEPESLADSGRRLGISRERARQLQERGLKRLSEALKAGGGSR